MITEQEIGHIIYDALKPMGLEMRLKGHLKMGRLDGESPIVDEDVPEEGMIVIIPKRITNDKTYFNNCTVEVNILMPDVNEETNFGLNALFRKAYDILDGSDADNADGDWYRWSVQSYGVESEDKLKCHYVNITLFFEILNVRK